MATLLAIKTAAQQRADMVGSGFITDSEWNAMVNASMKALYEKLIEAYGDDYEVATAYSITTDGTNDSYALPADFFKLLGVDVQLSPSATAAASAGWISLTRFNFSDRNRYTLPNTQMLWGRTNLKYRLRGSSIWFIPLPSAGQTLRAWYAPKFTELASDTDAFDAINGWEEWAVNDVAIKALIKEESPIDDLLKKQAGEEERLLHVVENRDAGSASTMVDVAAQNGNSPWGGYGDEWGY